MYTSKQNKMLSQKEKRTCNFWTKFGISDPNGKDQKGRYKVWQYGLWSFQTGGTKLERFLPKNQHAQRKLLNFENWVNGEVSKIEHHFSK